MFKNYSALLSKRWYCLKSTICSGYWRTKFPDNNKVWTNKSLLSNRVRYMICIITLQDHLVKLNQLNQWEWAYIFVITDRLICLRTFRVRLERNIFWSLYSKFWQVYLHSFLHLNVRKLFLKMIGLLNILPFDKSRLSRWRVLIYYTIQIY